MHIIQNNSLLSAVLSLLIGCVSCGQRTTSQSAANHTEVATDTLSVYPELPSAPLITPREADHANPNHTGYIQGWKNRAKNMYADTLQRTLKTLILQDVFAASETAEALRNDFQGQVAPVLVNVNERNSTGKTHVFWHEHSVDSIAPALIFSPELSSQFDCRFGIQDKKSILRASYPIELLDTAAFKPVIRIDDCAERTVYSPLFECFYRGKPFLICAFDIDALKSTPAGTYMWDIIRNYTYSDYFRSEMPQCLKAMDNETWFNTFN